METGPSNKLSNSIATTPSSVIDDRPKVSFKKVGFDTLVKQKGYPVSIDKTIKCPCSDKNGGQGIPGCRNCGGSGYVVYNRRDTHAIIHSINRDTKYKEWSEELLGTASFTTYHEVGLTYMDKITLKEGETIHNELIQLVLFTDDSEWRSGLRYDPLTIEAAFLFEGVGVALKPLLLGIHYVIEKDSILRILDSSLVENLSSPQISIRYSHYPEFLVIDIPRRTMNSLSIDPQTNIEDNLYYPVHAIVRSTHYVINMDSNDGTYLIDNSFIESVKETRKIYINGKAVVVDVFTEEQIPEIITYNGLIIFNKTSDRFERWNGTDWVVIESDSS